MLQLLHGPDSSWFSYPRKHLSVWAKSIGLSMHRGLGEAGKLSRTSFERSSHSSGCMAAFDAPALGRPQDADT